jgi:hypothetical protein
MTLQIARKPASKPLSLFARRAKPFAAIDFSHI